MKVTPTIPHISGFSEVEDLLAGGTFMQCTYIWRMSLEHYTDEFEILHERLVLEIIGDIGTPFTDRVAVIMEAPTQITYPTSHQMLGLDFEDVRERGMEGITWRAYDYESSDFETYCSSIRFERIPYTEQDAAMKTQTSTQKSEVAAGRQRPGQN